MLYGYYDIKKPLTVDDLKHWNTINVDYHMFFNENKKGEMVFRNVGKDNIEISGTYQKTHVYPIKKALELLNDLIIHYNISPEKVENIYGKKWLSVDEAKSMGFEGHKTQAPRKKSHKDNLASALSKNFRKML